VSAVNLDVLLTIGVLESGQYGYRYGSGQHQGGIPLVFDNVGGDLTLSLNGFDIDYNNEVSVSLNGVPIGFLSKGANNGLNAVLHREGNVICILLSEMSAGDLLALVRAKARRT